jgi:hypothetical protein
MPDMARATAFFAESAIAFGDVLVFQVLGVLVPEGAVATEFLGPDLVVIVLVHDS